MDQHQEPAKETQWNEVKRLVIDLSEEVGQIITDTAKEYPGKVIQVTLEMAGEDLTVGVVVLVADPE